MNTKKESFATAVGGFLIGLLASVLIPIAGAVLACCLVAAAVVFLVAGICIGIILLLALITSYPVYAFKRLRKQPQFASISSGPAH
jgi:hypothetical protein